MRDPDTTFDQLKALRLICRSFDQLCSARVLACIRLFGYDDGAVLENSRHLESIISSKRYNLPTYTLVIPKWRWIYGEKFYVPGTSIIPRGTLSKIFLLSIFNLYRCFVQPSAVLIDISTVLARLEARRRLNHTEEIGFSSIRRVE